MPPPTADEYGAHVSSVLQVHGDRLAIIKLMSKLPASERKMLPEVQQTADALYARATDLARTLQAMDSNFDTEGLTQIDDRIMALSREPDDPGTRPAAQPAAAAAADDRRSCGSGAARWRATWNRACWPCRTCASTCSGYDRPGSRRCWET